MGVGRVVVITGGSSGIGRATALACARRGDRLVLAARSLDSLRSAEQECLAAGAQTLVLTTDEASVFGLLQISSCASGGNSASSHMCAVHSMCTQPVDGHAEASSMVTSIIA